MNIPEQAEQLAQLASSELLPVAMLLQARESVITSIAQTSSIIGTSTSRANEIVGVLSVAQLSIEEAINAVQQAEKAMHDLADYYRG